jgi:hypothetical protein
MHEHTELVEALMELIGEIDPKCEKHLPSPPMDEDELEESGRVLNDAVEQWLLDAIEAALEAVKIRNKSK